MRSLTNYHEFEYREYTVIQPMRCNYARDEQTHADFAVLMSK